jgi:hypothetical protein
MAALGGRLVDLGFSVLPIRPGTKMPGSFSQGEWRPYSGWQKHGIRTTTAIEIVTWSKWPGCGIGIAGGTVVGIDIDVVEDATLAVDIEALAHSMLGESPCLRIGMAPKRLLVYRTLTPFAGFRMHPIEVLARGQQFVAYAIHPETGQPYTWPYDGLADTPLNALPVITEAQARAFAEAAYALIPVALRPRSLVNVNGDARGDVPHVASGRQLGTVAAIESALLALPNDNVHYDDWRNVGMATKAAIGDAGLPFFLAWSGKSIKDQPAYTTRTFNSFRNIHSVGAGTIYYLAGLRGWEAPLDVVMDGGAPVWEAGMHPAQALLTFPASLSAPAGEGAESSPTATDVNIFVPNAFRKLFPGSFIDLFVEHTLASAIHPQPIFAIAAALALVGVLAGRRYRSVTNVRTNIYVVSIGESASGKDHARGIVSEVLAQAGVSRLLGGNKLVSGTGILTALYRSPSSIFQTDEFGRFLKHVTNPKASKFIAEIWDNLTELQTQADQTFVGGEYANQKDNPRRDIIEPCCVMHATTVPRSFWDALRGGAVEDGSLARWLLFPTDDPVPDINRRPRDKSAVPEALIEAAKLINRGAEDWIAPSLGDGPSVNPLPYVVPMTPEVEIRLDALNDMILGRRRAVVGNGHGALLGRWYVHVVRVAMISAISRDPLRPIITEFDVEWSEAIVGYCMEHTLRDVETYVSDNDKEDELKHVLRIIKSFPNGIPSHELSNRVRFVDRRRREDILRDLLEGYQIVAEDRETGGRKARYYRLA